ncbi:tyrosine-type recombinase/integrase [Euzebya rosea]|uniref:tyrosine-type recombinase/integrase n=1 Tax=Euzebya rosea TaxID=2052804 RepID=UPI000D3E0BA5|nr:site-specific integrase [Euzebya rosea]
MAKRSRRHSGGTIRQLPSGRWQVRVRDGATSKLVALGTYATKADANAALRHAGADQDRGAWVPPERGSVRLEDYARDWLDSNPRIRSPRTRERYDGLLRLHIGPTIGQAAIGKITPASVRRWHTDLAASASSDTAAKAYRMLRAVLNTAVADELIVRNPCRLDGAGQERAEERPLATVAEVNELADLVDPRWRLLVLMGAWTSLRFGELAALTRADVDLMRGVVRVTKSRQRLDDGTSVVVPPKSAAGRRTVAIPPPLVPEIEHHLAAFAQEGADGLLFVGAKGAPLDRSHWNRRWRRARAAIGRDDLRFHDLRHTGNTLAAATGASTKELMTRMGHSSMAAALRYQHATDDRDQAIARALGEAMERGKVVELDDRRSG